MEEKNIQKFYSFHIFVTIIYEKTCLILLSNVLTSYCNLRQFSKQESTTLVILPPASDT